MQDAEISVTLGTIRDSLGSSLKLSFQIDNHGKKRFHIYAGSSDLRRSGVLLMLSEYDLVQLKEIVLKAEELSLRGVRVNEQVEQQPAKPRGSDVQITKQPETSLPASPKKKSWLGF